MTPAGLAELDARVDALTAGNLAQALRLQAEIAHARGRLETIGGRINDEE